MTTYTCPDKNCKVVIEGSDTIREILAHEKIHYKKKNYVKKIETKKCTHCDGTGKITEKFLVEER